MSAPPPVQYVTAADGTVLAYAVHGEGVPCLYLNPLGWHLERCWDVDAHRRFFDWLGARAQLIRVDYRGSGLSQRGAVDCSMARVVEDLDRVLAHLGVGPVAVLAFGPSTLVALAFANRFPARVARLALHHPVAAGTDLAAASGLSEIGPLIESNWELFTELSAAALFGTHDARASQQAALLRAAVTPAEFNALWQALVATDVSALLAEITAPALVILPSGSLSMQPNAVRRVAAALPNARVIGMESRFVARVLEDPGTLAAIAEFLGLPAGPGAAAPSQRTAVILFADVVDSTALTEQLGDAAFRARGRELDERLRARIRAAGGRAVEGKLLGDGVLAVFTSARAALAAALACRDEAAAAGLPLHLGLHAGDVIDEGGNVYGGAVNLAARVAAAAGPGEVLVTDTVRGLARTSADVDFADRGTHALKGVAESVPLFAVAPR